jgi:hypothetical protein
MKQVLKFNDCQLRDLLRAAKRVPYWARADFLQKVAVELGDKSVGSGNLQPALARAQREWCDYDRSDFFIDGVVAGT